MVDNTFKKFREKLGLSKYRIAIELCMPCSQWLLYENKGVVPRDATIQKIIRLAQKKGITLTRDEILGEIK